MIFLELLITFFEIGLFTFGGGYAMLPLIQEQVKNHGWISNQELVNFIAVSESTPGPFAINISTYIGMETGNLLGAFCVTFGVVLPSFIIILIVARFYLKFKNSSIVSGCMSGLKPAVIGLIGAAVISVGVTVFFPDGVRFSRFYNIDIYISLIIFVLMMILGLKKKHPIFIICISAVIGVVAGYSFHL